MKVIAKWLFLLLSFLFSHGQYLYPYGYWHEFHLSTYRAHTRRGIFCPEDSSRVKESVKPGYCPVTQSNGFYYSVCYSFRFLCCKDADCLRSAKCCHHKSFQHKVCLRPVPNFPITPGPAVVTKPSTATTEPTTTFRFTEPLMTTITNMPTTMNPTSTTTKFTTQTTTNSITNPEDDGGNDVQPEYMPRMNLTTTTTQSTTQTTTSSTIDIVEFGGISGDNENEDDDDLSIVNPTATTTESTTQTTTNSVIDTEVGSGDYSGDNEDDDDGSKDVVPPA